MGNFSASLRTVGDVNTLAANIELADGRLRIVVGDTEIGSWPLSEIHLEEIPTGYRMAVEGELLMLEFNDVTSFSEELAKAASKKRRVIGRKKEASAPQEATTEPEAPSRPETPDPVAVPPQPVETAKEPAQVATKTSRATGSDKPGAAGKILDSVDGLLLKAYKRYGAYLPGWVFSRGMLVICLALVALAVVFPGAASMVILIVGGLTVLFGAVVYSDTVLASRWLPGRATPQQALLTGLAIFLVGILLGVIAR